MRVTIISSEIIGKLHGTSRPKMRSHKEFLTLYTPFEVTKTQTHLTIGLDSSVSDACTRRVSKIFYMGEVVLISFLNMRGSHKSYHLTNSRYFVTVHYQRRSIKIVQQQPVRL